MKTCRFFKKTYRARILIESAWFPPFGFDIKEISSNSNENMSFLQKDVLCILLQIYALTTFLFSSVRAQQSHTAMCSVVIRVFFFLSAWLANKESHVTLGLTAAIA